MRMSALSSPSAAPMYFFLQPVDPREQVQRPGAQALVVALPELGQRAFGLRADCV